MNGKMYNESNEIQAEVAILGCTGKRSVRDTTNTEKAVED